MLSHLLPFARRIAPLAALLLAAACATTGATFRSGVGDAHLEHAPYYAGAAAPAGTIGHLPIAYQRGGSQPAIFDPEGARGTPVAELLAEMNAYLDSLGLTTRIALDAAPRGTPPDVQFGCEVDPAGDCAAPDDQTVLGRRGTTMRLAVGRPSAEWIGSAREAMDRANTSHAIVITLEIGQYRMHQRGMRGDKEVELGTANVAKLPWLTSLETPVSVLQLTGAVVDRDGKAVRIGAEGLLARRTSLAASALGAQALIGDAEVERVRTMRRDDLPGAPLAWQVALRTLAAQLAGKGALAVR